VVLVFLTRDYLRSRNCQRELTEAIARTKPILIVRETKEEQGAATLDQLRAEAATVAAGSREHEAVHALCTHLEGGEAPALRLPKARFVLSTEWFRERYLRYAVLHEQICTRLPCFEGNVREASEQKREATSVYLSPHYEGLPAPVAVGAPPSSVRAQLIQGFQAAGITVVDTPTPRTPVVVLLCNAIFSLQGDAATHAPVDTLGSPLLDELVDLLAMRKHFTSRTRIVPLYSTAAPFDDYLSLCPEALKERGLFTMMFNKWPSTSAELQPVAAAHAMAFLERSPAAKSFSKRLLASIEAAHSPSVVAARRQLLQSRKLLPELELKVHEAPEGEGSIDQRERRASLVRTDHV